METLRIYVDMDDTMCDFKKAYRRDLENNPGIKYPQSQHGFFRDLQVLDQSTWYVKAIADLGHDVWILTRPSHKNRLCYTEKADWVYKNMGEAWVERLIFCSDKSLLKGDLLIDDFDWPAFEGIQLKYDPYAICWKKIFLDIKEGKYARKEGLI